MPNLTLQQAFELALSHQRAGRVGEAEAVYREILRAQPEHPDALHRMGLVMHQAGRHEEAGGLIRRAIAAYPRGAEYQSNLGIVLLACGKTEDALAALRQAIALSPGLMNAHNALGNALLSLGRFDDAIESYRQALALQPGFASALNNLGLAQEAAGRASEAEASFREAMRVEPGAVETVCNLADLLQKSGRRDEALAMYEQALRMQPRFVRALNNLAGTLLALERVDEAIQAYMKAMAVETQSAALSNNLGAALSAKGEHERAAAAFGRAVILQPSYPEAHCNLANALRVLGRLDEAIAEYQLALNQRPAYPECLNNLGIAMQQKWRLGEAVALHRAAIRMQPKDATGYNNLANALKDLGQIKESIAAFRQSLALNPAADTHSNLVYAMLFDPGSDSAGILAEARAWAIQHAAPLAAEQRPHDNDRSPDRPLKIGYVSGDFRDHVVGRNVLPLLEQHDRGQFEVHCFSTASGGDELTARFRAAAHRWHEVANLNDAQLAERIRQAGIDLLVDLTLHMAGNRLLAFARRPAPVQITWAGYPGTTGLRAIDYRITDPYLDPPGRGDEYYAEKSVRLPHSFWCYRPPVDAPAVSRLPAETAGYVTFGCLNNFAKASAAALDLWAAVLAAVSGSRLLALCPAGDHRNAVLGHFKNAGVELPRIEFTDRLPRGQYLGLHHRIDICLDPLPYTGHSTSLDALWMGIPVVTLPGSTAVARGSITPLSNLGLTQCIAKTPADYVRIAASLAGDLPTLAKLRQELRQRMQDSPLCDEKRFARDMEEAYRRMWEEGRTGRQ